MHIDNVTVNADGSMTITLTEFLNQTQAATFVGATVGSSIVNPGGGQLSITITLTPGAPIVEAAAVPDPGGSAVIDG